MSTSIVTNVAAKPKMMSSIMFIAGNTVGAGILALPVMLGLAGFFPALIATFLLWIMMLFSGIVMAKQNILHKENVDLFSFFEISFGKIGVFIITIAYLFLFYGLSVAYISGATSCIMNFIPWKIPYYPVLFSVFTFLFFITIRGTKIVLKGNAIMMFLLIGFFFILIGRSLISFESTNLFYSDWKFLPATFPVLLCSFGFHNTIPLVAKTLQGDLKRVILALVFGTLIPFVFNILILLAVIGVLSPSQGGDLSLVSAFKNGLPATLPLSLKLHSNKLIVFGFLFSILAIFTSYLAVATGLMGFTRDLISRTKKKFNYGEVWLTFAIPLFITLFAQNLFLKAINFAAGIGATIIFGIMPCLLIVINGRKKISRIIGVCFLILFSTFFMIELCQQLGFVKILPKVF